MSELRQLDDAVDLFFSQTKLRHKLIEGDSTVRGTVRKATVDLTVTSPPYNVGKPYSGDEQDDQLTYSEYLKFSEQWLKNVLYWTKPTGRLCVNVPLDKNKDGKNPVTADITHLALKIGWKYHATVIWNEGTISRRTAWGSFASASAPHIIAPVETILVFYKDAWKRERPGENDITPEDFKDWVLGVWSFGGESAKRIGHEAPFPRELARRCIKLFSFVGDTVLDPFVGSGTTMIESIFGDRVAVGIEMQSKYCDLAKTRIQKECGLKLNPCLRERQGKPINRYWMN